LLDLGRTGDLVAILNREAREAEEMGWPRPRLQAIAFEPTIVARIIQVARDRPEGSGEAFGPDARRLVASLARAMGDSDAAAELSPDLLKTPPDLLALEVYTRLHAVGRLQEAVRALEEFALESVGKWQLQNYQSVAEIQLALSQFDRAAETIRKAAELAPADLKNEVLRCWLSLGQRQFDETRRRVQATLAKLPANADDSLGEQLRKIEVGADVEEGEFDAAEALVRAMIAAKPEDPNALYVSAYLSARRGRDLERAEVSIRQSLAALPGNARFLAVLGVILVRRGHGDDGLKILEALTKNESLAADPIFFDDLGDAYQQSGRAAEARRTWQKALELFPASTDPADRRRRGIAEKLQTAGPPVGSTR
jgi:Flp pilus assembly protein TadD